MGLVLSAAEAESAGWKAHSASSVTEKIVVFLFNLKQKSSRVRTVIFSFWERES